MFDHAEGNPQSKHVIRNSYQLVLIERNVMTEQKKDSVRNKLVRRMSNVAQGVEIELYIIQAKLSSGKMEDIGENKQQERKVSRRYLG